MIQTETGLRLIAVLMTMTSTVQAADTFGSPAYVLINSRASQNQSQFYVWEDVDSPFNHGFPSGLFGSSNKLLLNASCIYSASALVGCSSDPTAIDSVRGTVFQFIFDPLASGE